MKKLPLLALAMTALLFFSSCAVVHHSRPTRAHSHLKIWVPGHFDHVGFWVPGHYRHHR